jgi:hypothetical protein
VDVVAQMTDIEAFAAWKVHPDTNRAAFEALLSDAMSDIEFNATMRVISVIMSEKPCPTMLTELSA